MKKIQKSVSNSLLLLSVSLVMLLTNSCGTAYYGPAMLGSAISYQAKPMVADSLKSNNYLSGMINLGGADNLEDDKSYAELSFNRAHAFKNLNLSYGATTFLGNYTNGYIPQSSAYYFDRKSFWGYGLKTSINYVMPLGRTDFRFPGFEFSYTKEMGRFASFRKEMAQQANDIYTEPKTDLYTMGGSVEVIWRQKKYAYNRFSFRLFIGRTLGNVVYRNQTGAYPDITQTRVFSWSFMFQHKQTAFLYEAGRTLKLGMIYSFNKMK